MKNHNKDFVSMLKKYNVLDKLQEEREIINPYKMNWILYLIMLTVSICGIIFSFTNILLLNCFFIEIIKNLSLGCFTSTLVALLIEIANIKDKNKKAKEVYSAVYFDLCLEFKAFFQCWSEMCSSCIKEVDYKTEKHTWKEWYSIFVDYCNKCDQKRQKSISEFLIHRLEFFVDRLLSSLNVIEQQQYILVINELFNNSIKYKLSDFQFECTALKSTLEQKTNDPTDLLMWLDSITNDFEKYINNWRDIRYLNFYKHSPYSFGFDLEELEIALEESKKQK